MAGTVNIPLTRLAPGTIDFPQNGQALADTDTLAVLTIDRTVSQGQTQGFNGLTAATTCQIAVQQSGDSGSTWHEVAAATFTGGLFTMRGQQVNSNDVGMPFWPGTGRLARAEITVTGPDTVAVAGTLTIT